MATLSTPIVTAFTTVGDSFEVQIASTLKNVAMADVFRLMNTVTGVPVSPKENYVTFEYRWTDNNGQLWSDWIDCNGAVSDKHFWSDDVTTDDSLPYILQWRASLTTALDGTATSINITAIDTDYNVSAVSNDVRDRYFKSDSLFNGIKTDVAHWREVQYNLLEKVKGYGVVDEFVSRTDDFIHFWKSTVDFLTLTYHMGYKFASIYSDAVLLRRYLQEKGLFIPYNANISELQGLADSYITISRDRGTVAAVDEIKQIINKGTDEFFQATFLQKANIGWNTTNQTPTNGSLKNVREINLMPEDEWDEVTDKNNYEFRLPLVNTIVADTDPDGNAVNVFNTRINFSSAGISDDSFDLNSSKKILIDTRIDWEISFYAKTLEAEGLKMQDFGFNLIDTSGTVVVCEGLIDTPSSDNLFNTPTDEIIAYPVNEWIHVKGIIHNKNHAQTPDAQSYYDDAFGIQHLKFPSDAPDYVWIYPRITFGNSIGGGVDCNVRMYKHRVSPASTKDPVIGGVVGIRHVLLKLWSNNSSWDEATLDTTISRYLLDAKQNLVTINNSNSLVEEVLSERALFWWDSDNTVAADGAAHGIKDLGKDSLTFETSEGVIKRPSLNNHAGVFLDGSEAIITTSAVMKDADTYGIFWACVFRVDVLTQGVVAGQLNTADSAGSIGVGIWIESGNLHYVTEGGSMQSLGAVEEGSVYMFLLSARDSGSAYMELVNLSTRSILSNGVFTVNVNIQNTGYAMGSDVLTVNPSEVTMYNSIIMALSDDGGVNETLTAEDFLMLRKYLMDRYVV